MGLYFCLVGLFFCLVGCLVLSPSALEPTVCWMGADIVVKMAASVTAQTPWLLPNISATRSLFQQQNQPPLCLPGDPSKLAGRSGSGIYEVNNFFLVPVCVRPCVCPPSVLFLFSPVLWSSCNQVPHAFKTKFSGDFSSQWQSPIMGSLLCDSEPQFCERPSVSIIFPVFSLPTQGMGFDCKLNGPSYYLVASLSL